MNLTSSNKGFKGNSSLSRVKVFSLLLYKGDEEGHSVFYLAQKKINLVKSLKILIVALCYSVLEKVNIWGECVGNSCFLFPAPEEACHWSHGLSQEMFVPSSKSLVLPSSASIPFI